MKKLSNKYEWQIKQEDKKFKRMMHERKKAKQHKNKPKKESVKEKLTYAEQLSDKRWFKRREEIFRAKGRVCSKCGSKDNLQIHHIQYLPNKLAWEYKNKYLIVLCEKCHKKAHCIDLDEEFFRITRD
jgi:5-methylcytosine-specific restriction endonuclease McrA